MSKRKIPHVCEYCSAPFVTEMRRSRFCSRSCSSRSREPEPLEARFWSQVDKNGPPPAHVPDLGNCWTWSAHRDPNGYGRIGTGSRIDGSRRKELAHRVSWFLAHSKWPTDCVLHKCDNPSCVRPEHLFEGDRRDNAIDMVSKRRNYPARGEQSGMSKLNNAAVAEIRFAAASGASIRALAERFGVHCDTIYAVVQGKSWRHV
jgi:hypothetical protein